MLSFKVFEFDPNEEFLPSTETLRFWLYTQKQEQHYSGVVLPGLFATVGYPTQMLAFFSILLLEIAPTIYGLQQGVMIEAILSAVLIDIGLAVAAHWWQNVICENKNIMVTTDTSPDGRRIYANAKLKIGKSTLYSNIFNFLILISAVFKIYFFMIAYQQVNMIAGLIVVCYLLGAILHIKYTGYFFFTSIFNYKVSSDYKKYLKPDNNRDVLNNNSMQRAFLEVNNVIAKHAGNHSIDFDKKEEKWILKTKGVLTDKDLNDLLFGQPNNSVGYLAKMGLEVQLKLIAKTQGAQRNSQIVQQETSHNGQQHNPLNTQLLQ